MPPPRPPGPPLSTPHNREERSRAVRFDAAHPKIRSFSCDTVLQRPAEGVGGEDDGDAEDASGPAASWPQHAGAGHHIQVAVRCRPLHHHEIQAGARPIIKTTDSRTVVLEDPQITAADDYLRLNKSKERKYTFDEAFSETACTKQVFERTARLLIGGVLQGFNATVFAYGATGAGKTHTMLGSPSEPGIMMLTLLDLFAEVANQKDDRIFEVKCSFLEVYNENIRDLLRPDADYLDIREDPVKGMCVAGISEVGGLESAQEIMALLHQGNKHRSTEATGANVTSSRSHAVLQVVVEQRDRTSGIVAQVNLGKLSMIDLAGSERASQTNNKGMRMIEGANINRSLLALGNCITALSSAVAFVPYRDSKMTRLLKDSLGGNCRTAMIANVSPSHFNYEDTHNTLKYAKRASNIKTKAVRNVVRVNCHVSKYNNIIKELRGEISELKAKLADAATEKVPSSLVPGLPGSRDQPDVEASPVGPAGVDAESAKWKKELMQNFEERVRIKRHLIDLANQAQGMQVQKSHAQVGISQWESAARVQGKGHQTTPQNIMDLQAKLKNLKSEMARTEESTHSLEQLLVENQRQAERLQADLPSRVQNKDMRAFLGLVSRIYVMEVENMDMQEMNDVMGPLLQQKDLEAEALRLQIRMRDRMIEEQDELLIDEGVGPAIRANGWVEMSKPSRNVPSPLNEDKGHASSGEDHESPMGRGGSARASSQPPENCGRSVVVLPPLSPAPGRGRTVHRADNSPDRLPMHLDQPPRRAPRGGLSPLPGSGTPDIGGAPSPGAGPPLSGTSAASGGGGGSSGKAVGSGAAPAGATEYPSEQPPRPLDVAGRGLGAYAAPAAASGPSAPPLAPPAQATQVRSHSPLDVAGRGFGQPSGGASAGVSDATAPPRSPPREAQAFASGGGGGGLIGQDAWREGELDATRLPVVEGFHAMQAGPEPRFRSNAGGSDGPGPANGHGRPPDGRVRPLGSGSNGQRRNRKKNRRMDAGARALREKEQQHSPLQLHVEASGLHRGPNDDSQGSEGELITPPGGPSARSDAVGAVHRDHAAERKGIIEKLNRKMKPPAYTPSTAPKSLH